MSELKTLKDLDIFECGEANPVPECYNKFDVGVVNVKDLRKEAIKHIENPEEQAKKFWEWYSANATGSDMQQVCEQAMIWWIRYFFGIKEEDLKNG